MNRFTEKRKKTAADVAQTLTHLLKVATGKPHPRNDNVLLTTDGGASFAINGMVKSRCGRQCNLLTSRVTFVKRQSD